MKHWTADDVENEHCLESSNWLGADVPVPVVLSGGPLLQLHWFGL
jgi:hypothetical protein